MARDPGDTVLPVPFGGVFPWGPAGPALAAGDRAAWEQAVVREQQAGAAVALAQAPADADVEVVFGEVVEAILRAADDQHADLIVVQRQGIPAAAARRVGVRGVGARGTAAVLIVR